MRKSSVRRKFAHSHSSGHPSIRVKSSGACQISLRRPDGLRRGSLKQESRVLDTPASVDHPQSQDPASQFLFSADERLHRPVRLRRHRANRAGCLAPNDFGDLRMLRRRQLTRRHPERQSSAQQESRQDDSRNQHRGRQSPPWATQSSRCVLPLVHPAPAMSVGRTRP